MAFPSPQLCEKLSEEIKRVNDEISELLRRRCSIVDQVRDFSSNDTTIDPKDRILINTGIAIAIQQKGNPFAAYFSLPHRGETYRQRVERSLSQTGWTVEKVITASGRDDYKICFAIKI